MGVQVNNNPFSLYSTLAGMTDASNDIEGVIKAQVNLVKANKIDAADGWKEIRAVLRKYEPWGGMDTEPRNICAERYGKATDTNPGDWIWA
jgi:hypothetical protein